MKGLLTLPHAPFRTIEQFLSQRKSLVNSYINQLKFGDNKRIAVSCDPIFNIYSQIPAALSSIVILQNQLLPLITGILNLKVSTPKSLNLAMKKGIKSYGFDDQISNWIQEYWDQGGKYIRDVRNINEHFDALVDQTFFDYSQKPGTIFVFLPDNPEAESPKDYTYSKEIDAHIAIIDSLKAISTLIDKICGSVGIENQKFEQSISLSHVGTLDNHEERTLGLLINIEKFENSKVFLDTIEIRQVIPSKGNGNLSFNKLKVDSE